MSARRSRTEGQVFRDTRSTLRRPNTVHLDSLNADESFEELPANASFETEQSSMIEISLDSSFQQFRGGRSLTETRASSTNHPQLKRSQTACVPWQNSGHNVKCLEPGFEIPTRMAREPKEMPTTSVSSLCEIETLVVGERPSNWSIDHLPEGYVTICHTEGTPRALDSGNFRVQSSGIVASPPCQQATISPSRETKLGNQSELAVQVSVPSSSGVAKSCTPPGNVIILCDSQQQDQENSPAEAQAAFVPALSSESDQYQIHEEPGPLLPCQQSVIQNSIVVHKSLRDLINKTNQTCYQADSNKVHYKAGLSRRSSKHIPHLHDKFNK
ncbi:LAQU0S03e06546g1_1 [Lachancea quebecensis]|uniref:LAQU0S03e06546g1_1 n=1 Tax=Lachancea quebecensis TaxID=1654605 RepID=A0A0P1KRW5_9SACH|nr:LAQU0S03e06546g1_1 [Lachancea quebecensis]